VQAFIASPGNTFAARCDEWVGWAPGGEFNAAGAALIDFLFGWGGSARLKPCPFKTGLLPQSSRQIGRIPLQGEMPLILAEFPLN